MKPPIEHRIFPSAELRVQSRGSAPPLIVGYAAVFNSLSVPLWGFREKIAPGAFGKNLATNPDVRCLFNHSPDLILGRTKSRTLTLFEDERGLKIENEPPNSPTGANVLEAIRRGDVDQMSFAFRVPKGGDRWEYSPNGDDDIRTLVEVELFDVSPVTYPAYPETNVGLRDLPDAAISRIRARMAQNLPVSETERKLIDGDPCALAGHIAREQQQLQMLLEIARAGK